MSAQRRATPRDGDGREMPEAPDDPFIPDAGAAARLTGAALGIDVGGTGVKAALVDLASGELRSERVREKTPQPSTPEAVVGSIGHVVDRILEEGHDMDGLPAGCGLPGVVKRGHLTTAANIDKAWIGAPAERLISERLGRPVLVLNDADAAGVAEMTHGAGRGRTGTILLLTIGTGIGSAIFVDGRLVPNTELGHVEFHGQDAETLISGASRERRGLGGKRWAREFNEYLADLELYFSPDLILIGGGVSKSWDKYATLLKTNAPLEPAQLLNVAGIVGAALAAAAAWEAGAIAGATTPSQAGTRPVRRRAGRSRTTAASQA
jgi:polyphosphate glucokinase